MKTIIKKAGDKDLFSNFSVNFNCKHCKTIYKSNEWETRYNDCNWKMYKTVCPVCHTISYIPIGVTGNEVIDDPFDERLKILENN